MANPVSAFRGVKCDACGERLEEGDDLYMTDDGRMCETCAGDDGYVCDCGNFKKQEYETCWECK